MLFDNIDDWLKWKVDQNNKDSIRWYIELADKYNYPAIEKLRKTLIIDPFCKWAEEKGVLRKSGWKGYGDRCAKVMGCKDTKEYRDRLAQKNGYRNHREYNAEHTKIWRYNKGINSPMELNEDCSKYFGEFIAQNYVMKTFEDPVSMPPSNPGFDWLCKRGEKIDHKGACLQNVRDKYTRYIFDIGHNSIADYFLLSMWDNRYSLTPLQVLAFHKNDTVRGRKFCEFVTFSVANTPKSLKKLEKWEVTNRLDKLRELCNRDKKT